MVNKIDVEVFIVCLSCHFDVGQFPCHRAGGMMRWLMNQLGTPRGGCEEHNSKFFLSYETKV
jgi:hypothetical protein